MSFELTNVSTTFQDFINDTLRDYLNIFVVAYLDDILIYFEIMKQYVKHVKKVLECLQKRNLRIKSEKCESHKESVDLLEFVVEREKVRLDSSKIQAVKKWKASINVKKLQSFLNFVNYNRKFIQEYSQKTISLIRLTAQNIS